MNNHVLKTGHEWATHFNTVIIDPDGWRGDEKSMDEEIGMLEFAARWAASTCELNQSEELLWILSIYKGEYCTNDEILIVTQRYNDIKKRSSESFVSSLVVYWELFTRNINPSSMKSINSLLDTAEDCISKEENEKLDS